MKRLVVHAKDGDVVRVKVPIMIHGLLSSRQCLVEVLVEVRDIGDGKATLVIIGPSENDPISRVGAAAREQHTTQ